MPRSPFEGAYTPASIWDRAGGLVLDSLIIGLAQLFVGAAVLLLWLAGASLLASGSSCAPSLGSWEELRPSCASTRVKLFGLVMPLVWVAGQLSVWWQLLPRSIERRGGSPGMRVARLRILEAAPAGMPVGVGRATLRAVLAGLLPLLFIGPLLFAATVFGGMSTETVRNQEFVVAMLVVLAFPLYSLPWLWSLFDLRGQTLYDKLTGTVVVGPRGGINGWAIGSLLCGLTIVLAPFAVLFGHLGISLANRRRGQRCGAGAASAGLALGYLTLLPVAAYAVVLVIAWLADKVPTITDWVGSVVDSIG